MKFKKIMSISLATFMLVSSLSSSFIYADNKKEYTIALNEPYDVKSPKSVTALSVSTATAILTLATHAGITFHNSESMDEFLFRFIGLGNASNLISEIEKSVKSSVKGTISLTRSFLEELQKGFNVLTPNITSSYSIVGSSRILTVPAREDWSVIRHRLNNYNPSEVLHLTLSYVENRRQSKTFNIAGNNYYYATTEFSEGYFGEPHHELAVSCVGPIPLNVYDPANDDVCYSLRYKAYSEHIFMPVVIGDSIGYYRRQIYMDGTPDAIKAWSCSLHKIGESSNIINKTIDTTLGEGWSSGTGTIPGNDSTTSTDLDFKIPSQMDSLINSPPGQATTPTYPTWQPGTSIKVPSIANPGLEYIPEQVVPESPGDTDKPSVDAGSPDKPYWNILETITDFLKKIWQSILDILEWLNSFFDRLAQTLLDILSSLLNPLGVVDLIYEWLLNFFDTLLEFLTHILVPSENYFVDTFNDIKERLSQKLPNVDITKLEELGTGTKQFEDMYGTIFGQRVLLAKTSIIHKIISIAQPILQGIISLGLIVYNYNQIYFLIRGQKLSSARNVEGGKN